MVESYGGDVGGGDDAMIRNLRKLHCANRFKTVLSAGIRERYAENAEYAANSANAEVQFREVCQRQTRTADG